MQIRLWVWSSLTSSDGRPPSRRVELCFWEGDATKHFSVRKDFFSEKGGGNSVKEGLGKGFYRKGNSVKRSGPFGEPPESEN